MAEENIVLVTFVEESKAYQAASVLKQASAEGRIGLEHIGVQAVAVVQRMEDGTLRVKESDTDAWISGTFGAATGGLVGLTLGVLGGPLGILLGSAGGALVGSLVDLDAAEEAESVLATMARAIKPGTTALIARVTEPAVEVVDGEMGRLQLR